MSTPNHRWGPLLPGHRWVKLNEPLQKSDLAGTWADGKVIWKKTEHPPGTRCLVIRGFQRKRQTPISATMWKVLHNVHFHNNPMHGIRGMSARGGATSALYALMRRKLVAQVPGKWTLTPAGIAVLSEKE